MPKFQCTNTECENHTNLEYQPKVRFLWNATLGKLVSPYDECPLCGSHRKVFKEYAGFTQSWFKSEDSRNYDNKTIKKFDYDHDVNK